MSSRHRLVALRCFVACVAVWPVAADADDDKPVRLAASYLTDLTSVADGGVARGGVWLGRGDVSIGADADWVGVRGTKLFLDIIGTHGPDYSGRYVGDAQVVSNVQGDGVVRPYEAWIDVPFAKIASVRAGLIDLNTLFDVQDVGASFINSSFGVGPDFSQTGENGPSIFPVTSAAVVVKAAHDRWSARAGVFDAVSGDPDDRTRIRIGFPHPRGLLIVGEADRKIGRGEVQLGVWGYTKRFAALDPIVADRASYGGYGQVEGRVAGNDTRHLDAWTRLGFASTGSNRIGTSFNLGATYGGENARFGFALAHARQSDLAERVFAPDAAQRRAETAIELFWLHRVTTWAVVQPDIQYVIHPSWAGNVPNALVTGVRFSFLVGDR